MHCRFLISERRRLGDYEQKNEGNPSPNGVWYFGIGLFVLLHLLEPGCE